MNHVIKLKFYRMFNINIWKILGLPTWCLQEQEAEKAQINPVRANQKPQFDTIREMAAGIPPRSSLQISILLINLRAV